MPKPKTTEHDEQCKFIQYCRFKARQDPRYGNVIAIPNQRKWTFGAHHYFKEEGFSAGFPDLAILVPNEKYHGLFIEMKQPKGKVTKHQETWLNKLTAQGYACFVCRSANAAIKCINEYLAT